MSTKPAKQRTECAADTDGKNGQIHEQAWKAEHRRTGLRRGVTLQRPQVPGEAGIISHEGGLGECHLRRAQV